MSDQQTETVLAIKGFDGDLRCRGFQYAEGETYTHDGPVEVCRQGFHAVTMPLDVLRYYPPATSVYHEVELRDVHTGSEQDSKVAAREIKIGARLELPALIKAQVDFVFKNARPTAGATSKKHNAAVKTNEKSGAATASGDRGAATASGDHSVAVVTGRHGRARGALGSWIVLTERDVQWRIVEVRAVKVDGIVILPDQFYVLRDGNVVKS